MGRLHVSQNGSASVVAMIGDFDLSTAREVRECLLSVGPRVVLDMGETTFIDSTTLNIMLAAHNAGTEITIVDPPALVRRVLAVTHFDELFSVKEPQPNPTSG